MMDYYFVEVVALDGAPFYLSDLSYVGTIETGHSKC